MSLAEGIRQRNPNPYNQTHHSGTTEGLFNEEDLQRRLEIHSFFRGGSESKQKEEKLPKEPVEVAPEKKTPQPITLEDFWIPPWDKEGRNNRH